MKDVKLRLGSAITLIQNGDTVTTVTHGVPLTVKYSVTNAGSETWSGYASLWIERSDGTDPMCIQENEFTPIYAGGTEYFTFSNNGVESPEGTTKFYVKVKNYNASDYNRYYDVGDGSYANPLVFQIVGGGGGSCKTCPDYDETWSLHNIGFGEWSTKSSSIVSGGCRIYKMILRGSNTYTFQTCDHGTATFDTWLYLLDANCNLVAQDDDGCTGRLSHLEYTTGSSDAIYYLKIVGYNGAGGSFTIAAKRETETLYFVINASASPSAGGTVSGAGTYQSGSTCTLTATANTGYTFTKWTKNGTQVSTNASYTFTVTENASYVAVFSLNSYTISASASPGNGGGVSGGGTYNHGSTCTLTATANTGYNFTNWKKNGTVVSTNPIYSFTVTSSGTYVANFAEGSSECPIVFDLYDSYGDGWNGNKLAVTYNGSEYAEITLESGSSGTQTLMIDDGSHVTLTWIQGGWVSECSFTVSYSNGNVIYYGTSLSDSFVYEFDVDCMGMPASTYDVVVSANITAGGSVSGGGTYNYGATCTLTATANTGYNFTNWTKDGTVVSTSASYSFTVTSSGTYVANFEEIGGDDHTYVDLGLPSGMLWATCNVGANSPEEYGDYFAWGETQPKDYYHWSTYQYCMGSNNTLTKYCTDPNYGYNGFTDNLTILLPEDDAATANWGNGWRMPTKEEWQELYQNTTVTWTQQNGVNGRLFTASNGSSLFLPAAGGRWDVELYLVGSRGYYWSSSLYTGIPSSAWRFLFYSGNYGVSSSNRYGGLSVRAVRSSQSLSYTINATPNPVAGGAVSGGGAYAEGATCTLTATPAEGYTFISWTEDGEVVSTEAEYSFTVTGDRDLVANFVEGLLCSLTIEMYDSYGDGWNGNKLTVSDDLGGYHEVTLNGGSSGSTTLLVLDGSHITLGWIMGSWTSECSFNIRYANGNLIYHGENMSSDFSFEFDMDCVEMMFFITATASPNESGTISGAGGYEYNSTCTLTATANTGYTFTNWTKNGTVVSTNPSYSFTVTSSCTYVAHFSLRSYIISASASPSAGGSVSGAGNYYYGATCTLTATANTGYTFTNWTKNGTVVSTNASYSFTVTSSGTYVAHFSLNSYTISASASPSTGGTVSGGGTYNYGATCTLTATANTGYTFTNWTKNGTVVSTNASYSFTVTSSGTYVAHFSLNSYTISASASPSTGGTVSGGGTYNYGATCTLTATSNTGYTFTNWTKNGTVVSTNASYSFTVTSSGTYVAHFSQNILSIGDYTGDEGEILTVNINLANEDEVSGFQFDIPINEGFTYVEGSIVKGVRCSPNHIIFGQLVNNGTALRVLCYSMPLTNISGNDGTIASFQILLGEAGTYELGLADCYLSNLQGGTIPCTVINGSLTVGTFDVTVTANPAEGGTVTGAGTYDYGTSVTIAATANYGYTFANWTEDGEVVSTDATYSFVVTEDRNLVANFSSISMNILSISDYTGAEGEILTIDINLANEDEVSGFQFDIPINEGFTYVEGSLVKGVRCSPNHIILGGMVNNGTALRVLCYSMPLTNISGNDGVIASLQILLGEAGTYELGLADCVIETMTGETLPVIGIGGTLSVTGGQTVTYNITATVNPAGAGTVTGAGEYEEGETATLVATAFTDFYFVNWTENGTVVSTSKTYSFVVTGDRNLVANFAQFEGNYLSIGNYNGVYNQTITAGVNLDNGDEVAGLQVDIPLGDNFTYVEGTIALTDRATANHVIYAGMINHVLRVIVYSLPSTPFIGTTGEIFTFGLTLGTESGIFPLPVENAILSDVNGTSLPVEASNGSVTVVEPEMFEITATAVPNAAAVIEGVGIHTELSTATLTAIANPGYEFVNWTENGEVISTDETISFVVLSDRHFVVNFNVTASNILSIGDESGFINTNTTIGVNMDNVEEVSGLQFDVILPEGITYVAGSAALTDRASANHILFAGMINPVTLRVLASAMPSGNFSGTTGDVVTFQVTGSEEGTYALQLDNPALSDYAGHLLTVGSYDGTLTLTNQIQPQTYTIAATVNPVGAGTVTGAGEYEEGTIATLVATAVPGNDFVNWTEGGTEVSTDATYSFVVTEDRAFVANFTIITYKVTVTANPPEGGIVTGAGTYDYGTSVTIATNPNVGYTFNNWTEDGEMVSTNKFYTFTITDDHDFIANFTLNNYDVTVAANPTEGGTVTGAGTYNHGATATLNATVNSGYTFINWTKNGTVVSTNPTYSFTVTEDASYVANFELNSYTITATANPIEGGTVIGAGTYNHGTTAILMATANTGYTYINWTKNGTVVSTNPTYSFTVTEDASYVANFELNSYTITATANPIEGGTVIGAGTYNHGATATLMTATNTGYTFINWTKNGTVVSTEQTYSFTVTEDVDLVANFKLPGDANGDGTVNALDIVIIVNHIFGATPEEFVFDNADVNGDGVVDALDIVIIINLIFSK